MTEFIRWAAFFGGWLLFAGPLYQASLELRELEFDREAYAAVEAQVGVPGGRVSGWWWILPPVAYVLIRRRERVRREAVWSSLNPEQQAQTLQFLSVGRGWLIVAAGAFLIALKETWELVEHYHWDEWVFVALVVLAGFVVVINTAVSATRTQHALRNAG